MTPHDVTDFWMRAGPARWFARDGAFDGTVAVRFGISLAAARTGAFDHWADTAAGSVGLVILLDQMPRNIHRGSPLAFAADSRALAAASKALLRGYHQVLRPPIARWLVMPFLHAEDIDAQRRAVALFATMGRPDLVHWARLHLDVIARFGRFPHRNRVLGRPSTRQEIAFLDSGGFAG
jgi:uncharacterized protein (DUF924 family)